MKKLDAKFHGVVVKNKDGSIVPPDQWIVFLAKDNALLPTLEFYFDECRRIGAGDDQLDAAAELIIRVKAWRKANPDLCKVPDASPEELCS